ncbi:MAG: hypothetical protein Q7T01_00515 [bacterium]|nr:hypothetical protein [bacterium]
MVARKTTDDLPIVIRGDLLLFAFDVLACYASKGRANPGLLSYDRIVAEVARRKWSKDMWVVTGYIKGWQEIQAILHTVSPASSEVAFDVSVIIGYQAMEESGGMIYDKETIRKHIKLTRAFFHAIASGELTATDVRVTE